MKLRGPGGRSFLRLHGQSMPHPYAPSAVSCLVAAILASSSLAAHAAVAVGITVDPRNPVVGSRATIRVATFVADDRAPNCRGAPLNMSGYPFQVRAEAPNGSTKLVPIAVTDDAHEWAGAFSFTEPGRWRIRINNFESSGGVQGRADPRCYSPLTVVVAAASSPTSSLLMVGIAVAAVGLVASLLPWLRRRRRASRVKV